MNPSADFWEMDILEAGLADRFQASAFDLVYHLAAQIDVRKSVANPEFDNQINVLGGLNIIKRRRSWAGLKK